MSTPLLTAIVSTYAAERFMRGCLEDLAAQTLLKEMEIVVIDSGSPQGEGGICQEFGKNCAQLRYVRTEREPLYVAWNRAVSLARGKYLTSANTDDRHSPQFAEKMVGVLESRPDVLLVYADQYVSQKENETYASCAARNAQRRRWPDYTPEDLLLRCIVGSQPVWKKAAHALAGVFDPRYTIVGDYEMWLRFASYGPMLHVPEPLGVFFDSPSTLSGASNRLKVNTETLSVQMSYVQGALWRGIPGIRKRLASEVFGRGYQHIERDRDTLAARPFIRAALKLDPGNMAFLKTYLLRCVLGFAAS